jgi:hypothetical protein
MAAVTAVNHPLIGSRYWRAFEPTTGHIVVETGAVDMPNIATDATFNIAKFALGRRQQLKIWEEELKWFLQIIQESYGGQEGITPEYNIVEGAWERKSKRELMQHICGHTPTPAGYCQ